MPSLPVLLLFTELLTQSMWNTVSPEVRISVRIGGKRNLRQSSSLYPFPSNFLFMANSSIAVDESHTTGFKLCPCRTLWPLWGVLWLT